MKKVLIALLLGVLPVSAPLHSQTVKGEPITRFTLQDVNGTFHNQNEYKGKVLAVYLFGHD